MRFYLAAAAQSPARTGFCSMLSFILDTFDFIYACLLNDIFLDIIVSAKWNNVSSWGKNVFFV
jgi:hypothetical protein